MDDTDGIRLIDGRRMQCKDVPDVAFLDAVRGTAQGTWLLSSAAWDVQEVVKRRVGPVPGNLFRAKARRLIQRGLLDGCACGCRGDYSIPTAERVKEALAGALG